MNNTADGADFICLKGVRQVLDQVNGIILGKEKEVKEIMTAFLANGHILLEDIPGVGKTTMAIAFSKSMAYEMCLLHPLASVFCNLRLFSDRTGTGDFYRDTSRPSFAYISDLFGSDTF